MNIAFFTETEYTGKIPRNNSNMRTDTAWICALNADHYNIHNQEIPNKYDLGICIIPKNNPKFNLNAIKKSCNKIASMQEGPSWYFQDYPLDQQIWYYNTLQEMDFLCVHNIADKKYYEGLTGKQCMIMQTLMIEDMINTTNEPRNGVMIGGNFCSWYGGFDSYMVAQEFQEQIFVPSMGRKIDGEEQLENLNHLPYMRWSEWIEELNKVKYGVHLMRTQAAGTFALNCAYLGIPCIGYKGLDTQMICHPNCTVELGDLYSARKIAKKLNEDKEFYNACSTTAKIKYKEHFLEKMFKENFNNSYEKIR